jgi:hypothetical protein
MIGWIGSVTSTVKDRHEPTSGLSASPASLSRPSHARLDAETGAKLEALATAFQKKHARILRYVMLWGLSHTQKWNIDPSIPDRTHLVHMLVDRELYRQVHEAADAHGTSVSAGIRHAMRLVIPTTFRRAGVRGRLRSGRMSPAMTVGGFSSGSILTRRRSSER